MKKVKLLSLFLALTLILGCFVGCNGTKKPTMTTTPFLTRYP